MTIHEYQAKRLLASYGVPVPRGSPLFSVEEAERFARGQDFSVYVLKVQIHAGGRGKAGGVKLTRSREEVGRLARDLLGTALITPQTGPEGKVVTQLLIEEGVRIKQELYLSLLVNWDVPSLLCIASREGGVEIEEVAARSPRKIFRQRIDPAFGVHPFQGRAIAKKLLLPTETVGEFVTLLRNLYRFFIEKGLSLLEINPLALTEENTLVVLDAKVVCDDNELFRQEEMRRLRDPSEEDPLEREASQCGLNYVRMGGHIGCMVNGAGLAMTTMDVIKLAGGAPANFLDVGGGASQETVKRGFEILLKDPRVKGIFVNIFGGIVRCERIAGGIVEATGKVKIRCPLVVRLEGTNAKEGSQILTESDLPLTVASDLWDGAQKIVAMSA